jgi:hypothetical protein
MDIKILTQEEADKKKLTWVRNTYRDWALSTSHIQELKEKYPAVEFYIVFDGNYYSLYADNIYSLFLEIEQYETWLKMLPEMTIQIRKKIYQRNKRN